MCCFMRNFMCNFLYNYIRDVALTMQGCIKKGANNMIALLSRADQAVSITDIARSAKKYFDRLIAGEQDRYIVMRNNIPAAVVLPVDYYETLISEIDDLKMELIAIKRLANMDKNTKLVSHEDMFARYK